MKRLILAAIFCVFVTTAFAQNDGLGFRVGSGLEVQYEHTFSSNNLIKANAGMFDFDGSFFGTCVYDWEVCNWSNWTPNAGNWFLQAGVGAALGIVKNTGFNVGIAGDVAFGIHFSGAPISLSADYRPTVFLLNDSLGSGFGSIGLSCVFHF